MRIAVEISLYPLDSAYLPCIKDFIDRIQSHTDLSVTVNAMSTQIAGEHERVFALLSQETAKTFAEAGRRVFIMKVLGGAAAPGE